LSLMVILSVSYFIIFYSGFQLKNILISGNDRVKTNDLQELVSNDANTQLINFWNIKIISRSIFLINSGKINKDILEKFPSVEKANISQKLPQTLILNIAERKPVGVFCPLTSSGQADSGCFLIDQSGIIFEPQAAVPVDVLIVRQTAENGQLSAGQEVVAQDIISAIYKIQKMLKDNFQIDSKEALIANPLRLNIMTDENWQIYFDLSSDINLQITKLNLLLNSQIPADKRGDLRYIDLRPKDRAIICDNEICGH
jgi:cell division septal protein FtsQ